MIPPVFILVRPQMGENIGAAARAMLNFGLERMRVVGPARRLAEPEGGGDGLRRGAAAGRGAAFPRRGPAIADCDFVFATTARGRELVKDVVTPERAMAVARRWRQRARRSGCCSGRSGRGWRTTISCGPMPPSRSR
jgi:tRNA/rRNA methyltransferase